MPTITHAHIEVGQRLQVSSVEIGRDVDQKLMEIILGMGIILF